MEFIPLAKPFIENDEINKVTSTLKSGWLSTGPVTQEFEEEFQKYIGSKHAISVNSCTAALHLSLIAAGVKENDEVITTPFTFVSTAEVILYLKAKPVFVDIRDDTFNIDEKKIEAAITHKTKAIIPVHYAGHPCEMDIIKRVAKKYSLKIIEDAAHATGAKYSNTMIGNIGDFTCFSFYATKNMTTGEGGMITTNNDEAAELIKMIRLHGISRMAWNRYLKEGSWKYDVLELGYKYNLSDICSSLGICQLKKIDVMNKMRRDIFNRYNHAFGQIKGVQIPIVKNNVNSAYHLYPILLDQNAFSITRDEFIEHLKKKGIGASVHFIPLHHHPYYKNRFGFSEDDFPVATKVGNSVVSLPLYPGMTDAEVDYVIDSVQQILKQKNSYRVDQT